MSDDSSTRRRIVGAFGIPVVLVGVLIIVVLLLLSYLDNGSRQINPNKEKILSSTTMQKLRRHYDKFGTAIGSKNAAVTIREFGGYQCRACKAFLPVAQKIRNKMVPQDSVRYIFFDYPLPAHRHAFQAAIAARCAGHQQGAFWTYHDRLYTSQQQWSQANDTTDQFLHLAAEVGLKTKPLKQCIAHQAPKPIINHEKQAAKTIGLRAIPTIIVGDRVISGDVPYSKIKRAMARQR